MTNTRSGMTHAAIEEMIDQRVNAALEAHQLNQKLNFGNGNNNGTIMTRDMENDNGNGNGGLLDSVTTSFKEPSMSGSV
ncbi:hypothetical protein Tco_0033554 [Tanacetum coccineum]